MTKDYFDDAPRPKGSEQPNRGPGIERLLSLLENATEGSRELDAQVGFCAGWDNGSEWRYYATKAIERGVPICHWAYSENLPAYTTSLDAALTLVPSPKIIADKGRKVELAWTEWLPTQHALVNFDHHGCGKTLVLSLCIAALKANATVPKSVPSFSPTQDRGASSQESLPESNNQSETP